MVSQKQFFCEHPKLLVLTSVCEKTNINQFLKIQKFPYKPPHNFISLKMQHKQEIKSVLTLSKIEFRGITPFGLQMSFQENWIWRKLDFQSKRCKKKDAPVLRAVCLFGCICMVISMACEVAENQKKNVNAILNCIGCFME